MLVCDADNYMSENRAENYKARLVLKWEAILPIVSLTINSVKPQQATK